ncbi:MAG: hypothetical protein ABIF01_03785, partial [Candidatus Micrarchaeota archaeon]
LGIKPATQLRVLPYAGDVTQYQGPEDPKTVPLADLIAANKAAKDRLRVAEGITEQLQPYPNVHAFGEKLAELNPDVVHNGEVGYIVNENPLQEFDPRKMEHGLKKVPMPETIEEGFLRCWSMPSQSVTGYQRALYLGYGVEAGRRFLRRSVDKESRRRVIDDKLGEGTADQLGQFQTHIIADIYEEPRQRPEYKYYKPEMIEPLDPGEPHFRALCNASQYGFEALDPEVGCRAFEDGQARESFNKDLEQAFWSVNPHRIDQHVEATPETRRRVTQQMIGDFGLEGVRTELIDVRNPSLAEEREFVDSLNTAIMKKYG